MLYIVMYLHVPIYNYLTNAYKKRCPTTRHGGAWGERRHSSYLYLTSALDGGEWSASRPGRALPPGKGPPGTHWIGGWMGPRAGPNSRARRKNPLPLSGIEPRSLDRPARSQTLYCLSYRGSD
jgi:hypothetical protein